MTEIIDYHQRQPSRKSIGSGRGEKVVDVIIENYQKNKGMSWPESASRALAIPKTLKLYV